MIESDAVQARNLDLKFHGETGEYFRIWIVNIALTIATLGIYSAWAKVRKLRYFYGKTELDGANFEYHAKPQAILIGRIIAVSVVAAYTITSYYAPVWAIAIMLCVTLLIPVIVVRAHTFQLRNTSHRQVRFNFEPNYKGAFKAYYLGMLIAVVTLGLAMPYTLYMRRKFSVDNASFGQTRFQLNADSGPFFAFYYATLGLLIGGFIVLALVIFPLIDSAIAPISESTPGSLAATITPVLVSLPIMALYGFAFVFYLVRERNFIWSNTRLGRNEFSSSLSVFAMFRLYAVNVVAIVFSLGLAIPWAQIRLARYRAENTNVVMSDSWDRFLADQRATGSSLGEEVGEAFDVGVDFAI